MTKLKSLLDQDPSCIDVQDKVGVTAMLWAAKEGNFYAVDELLERGAFPDIRTKEGLTPLMAAAFHNRRIIIRSLLRKVGHPASRGLGGLHWMKLSPVRPRSICPDLILNPPVSNS